MAVQIEVRLARPSWVQQHSSALRGHMDALGTFTVSELCDAAGTRQFGQVGRMLQELVALGQLSVKEGGRAPRYSVVSLLAERTTRRASDVERRQQQMWNILRGREGREGVGVETLSVLSSTAEIEVSVRHARSYVHALVQAGYLVERDAATYRLAPRMNTGPTAPALLQATILLDPNKGADGRVATIDAKAVLP